MAVGQFFSVAGGTQIPFFVFNAIFFSFLKVMLTYNSIRLAINELQLFCKLKNRVPVIGGFLFCKLINKSDRFVLRVKATFYFCTAFVVTCNSLTEQTLRAHHLFF